jgi:hypothetical protein
MNIRVDVSVIVGANQQLIFDCLDSFLKYAPPNYTFRIIVTCNQANTGMPDRLHSKFDIRQWEILENCRPRGFAENHNAVLKDSTADYVFILNDDLVFTQGAVEKMLGFMERPENQKVAMLSPKLLNPDGTLQPSTYGFPSALKAFMAISGLRQLIPFSSMMNRVAYWIGLGRGNSRFWEHDRIVDVDTFRGACVLGRMKAVREVGLMHTISLATGEEMEWHYRFWKFGWRVVFFPEAQVIHIGQQTIRTNPALRNESLKAYLYFFKKHYSRRVFYTFSLLTMVALCIRYGLNLLVGHSAWAKIDLDGILIIRQSL